MTKMYLHLSSEGDKGGVGGSRKQCQVSIWGRQPITAPHPATQDWVGVGGGVGEEIEAKKMQGEIWS